MEFIGLCSTPKAEHKDYKIQPQGKNTSVTSRSISTNQTCWLKPAVLSHCFPPSPPLPSSTKTPESRGSPLPGTQFVGHPLGRCCLHKAVRRAPFLAACAQIKEHPKASWTLA